jgi:hypothetical protein
VLCFGTLASRFAPLELLPWHQSDWFLQFRAKACIRFTPPLRRSPSAQSSGHPTDLSEKGFSFLVLTTLCFFTTRPRRVHFRSSLGCSPAQVFLELFLQRSPPRLFTAAAWSGLTLVSEVSVKVCLVGPPRQSIYSRCGPLSSAFWRVGTSRKLTVLVATCPLQDGPGCAHTRQLFLSPSRTASFADMMARPKARGGHEAAEFSGCFGRRCSRVAA